jgi:hypothetical protein
MLRVVGVRRPAGPIRLTMQDMTNTPQDPPQNEPASPVEGAPATATDVDSPQVQTEAAKGSDSKKPWWKIWG